MGQEDAKAVEHHQAGAKSKTESQPLFGYRRTVAATRDEIIFEQLLIMRFKNPFASLVWKDKRIAKKSVGGSDGLIVTAIMLFKAAPDAPTMDVEFSPCNNKSARARLRFTNKPTDKI
jgi:hypothetical protein